MALQHVLCRDCATLRREGLEACAACGSPRAVSHPELTELTIAHIDCDAFYASVEKRDAPELLKQFKHGAGTNFHRWSHENGRITAIEPPTTI